MLNDFKTEALSDQRGCESTLHRAVRFGYLPILGVANRIGLGVFDGNAGNNQVSDSRLGQLKQNAIVSGPSYQPWLANWLDLQTPKAITSTVAQRGKTR